MRLQARGGITSPFVFYRHLRAAGAHAYTGTGEARPGLVVDAGWDGARFITNLLWDGAGADTSALGAEWLLAPETGAVADPPRPDRPNLVRWESALNVRAGADLVQEVFTPATLTPAFLDPDTGGDPLPCRPHRPGPRPLPGLPLYSRADGRSPPAGPGRTCLHLPRPGAGRTRDDQLHRSSRSDRDSPADLVGRALIAISSTFSARDHWPPRLLGIRSSRHIAHDRMLRHGLAPLLHI